MDGKPITLDLISPCIGVNKDRIVRYVTLLVWCKSSSDYPVKLDYGKYLKGKEDYIL